MEPITLKIRILEPIEKVWNYYTMPEHIVNWNFASDEWSCPKATSDFNIGGKFNYRMEAKDASFGFDFSGVFEEIVPLQKLKMRLDDGRNVEVFFNKIDGETTDITQTFDPEGQNPVEMQRESWYKMLDNFHKYTENN